MIALTADDEKNLWSWESDRDIIIGCSAMKFEA